LTLRHDTRNVLVMERDKPSQKTKGQANGKSINRL
jgi:hypothetical protein